MQFVQCVLIRSSALINVSKLGKLHWILNFNGFKIRFIWEVDRDIIFDKQTHIFGSLLLFEESIDQFLGKAAEVFVKWFEALIRRVEGCWKSLTL